MLSDRGHVPPLRIRFSYYTLLVPYHSWGDHKTDKEDDNEIFGVGRTLFYTAKDVVAIYRHGMGSIPSPLPVPSRLT